MIRQWSTSKLTMLQMCGEKFRRHYLDNDRMPGGPPMHRGLAVDRAVSESLVVKKKTGDEPIAEANRDIAATEFEKTWSEGVWFNPEERQQDTKKLKASTKDAAVDLAGLHANTLGRQIQPIEIQHKIETWPLGNDISIVGFIDIVDLQADETRALEVIRDTKTKEKAPNPSDAHESQQLTMYALLRMAETGRMPDALALDVLWKTPAKGELKHQVLPTTRTKDDFVSLVNRINEGIEAVDKGVFIPASEGAWNCSPRWCAYWDTCRFVRRPVSISV